MTKFSSSTMDLTQKQSRQVRSSKQKSPNRDYERDDVKMDAYNRKEKYQNWKHQVSYDDDTDEGWDG